MSLVSCAVADNRYVSSTFTFREARSSDVDHILDMLQASAMEQGFPNELAVTAEELRADGFGPNPRFEVILAESGGTPAGMALYFFTYSTWVSRLGLYLEDLYVLPEHRSKGVAQGLMRQLAAIALEHGCHRFQWVVHRGNEKALAMYRSLGAQTLDDWALMSIKGEALDAFRPPPGDCA